MEPTVEFLVIKLCWGCMLVVLGEGGKKQGEGGK